MFADFFARHEKGKVVLEFSSGKDSAACLWLLRPFWDRLTVLWCNPGNPLPETVEYMNQIAQLVPSFAVVLGNQRGWVRKWGHPTDVLPYEATELGLASGSGCDLKLSFVADCCGANLWFPMYDYVKKQGYTGVIRGQKLADSLRGPIKSGELHEGIEYLFPIDDWTDEDVIEYLGPERLPSTYKEGVRHSIDCANCTAYSRYREGVQPYLDKHHPAIGTEVRFVRRSIAKLLTHHVDQLTEL